eukprot:15319090-Alexandrium_andersonii.AAC.1
MSRDGHPLAGLEKRRQAGTQSLAAGRAPAVFHGATIVCHILAHVVGDVYATPEPTLRSGHA